MTAYIRNCSQSAFRYNNSGKPKRIRVKFYRDVYAELKSHVLKFWRWDKGVQNEGEKVGFCNGYNEVFLTGQIGMKFGKKRQSMSCIEF